jgi:hypothetical protein
MQNSMMIITSSWGTQKTFKMIPTAIECPYNECIYDPQANVLAVISKERKQTMHMMAKLNEWGDVVPMKVGKRSNGKDYAEERKTLETYYEYFIEDLNEIRKFIKHFASNKETSDWEKYLTTAETTQPSSILTSAL